MECILFAGCGGRSQCNAFQDPTVPKIVDINDKIVEIAVLFLTLSQLCFSFLLPLRKSVLLEIIASPNKCCVILGTEMKS